MKQWPALTLTNEDCMDLLARTPDKYYDLAIVDPPYGIGRDGKRKSTSSHGGTKAFTFKGWDIRPSAEYFENLFRVSKEQIIWGANYYPEYLTASSGWVLWDKGQRIDQADGELAFTSLKKPLRVFTLNRCHIGNSIHPTQKPVALYKWLLSNYAKPNDKILGTHLGSGSIAIACLDMGFELTGCELDADYFQAMTKRIATHMAQTQIF